MSYYMTDIKKSDKSRPIITDAVFCAVFFLYMIGTFFGSFFAYEILMWSFSDLTNFMNKKLLKKKLSPGRYPTGKNRDKK